MQALDRLFWISAGLAFAGALLALALVRAQDIDQGGGPPRGEPGAAHGAGSAGARDYAGMERD